MSRLKPIITGFILLATALMLGLIFVEAIKPPVVDYNNGGGTQSTQLVATVAILPTGVPTPEISYKTHIVMAGDSLYYIALQYELDTQAVMDANGLNETSVLDVGQELIIPVAAEEINE